MSDKYAEHRVGLPSSGEWPPMLRAVDVVLHLPSNGRPRSDEWPRVVGFHVSEAFERKCEAWFGAGPEELAHLAGWEPLLERLAVAYKAGIIGTVRPEDSGRPMEGMDRADRGTARTTGSVG